MRQDKYDDMAEQLLLCPGCMILGNDVSHFHDCPIMYRPAVAAELRRQGQRIEKLETAIEGLLDGLDSNGDPDRCGLSESQWEQRITQARATLKDDDENRKSR